MINPQAIWLYLRNGSLSFWRLNISITVGQFNRNCAAQIFKECTLALSCRCSIQVFQRSVPMSSTPFLNSLIRQVHHAALPRGAALFYAFALVCSVFFRGIRTKDRARGRIFKGTIGPEFLNICCQRANQNLPLPFVDTDRLVTCQSAICYENTTWPRRRVILKQTEMPEFWM